MSIGNQKKEKVFFQGKYELFATKKKEKEQKMVLNKVIIKLEFILRTVIPESKMKHNKN